MSDPLIGMLVLLPLVVAGLWAAESWVRSRDRTVGSPISDALQVSLLAVLILAALGRSHLGLLADGPSVDALLAGGLLALLMIRVVQLVGAMAGTVDFLESQRPAWPFAVLPLVVYVAVLPWATSQRLPDGDEPYYLLITHSLVNDFDTELTNNYAEQHSLQFTTRALEPEWADPVRPDGRLFSRHSMVLPLILTPGYWVAGKWGAMITMALIAAAVGWLSLYLAVRHWGRDHSKETVWTWALLTLTPPVLLYSHQIWVELPAALLVLVALHRIQDLQGGEGDSPRRWIVLGLALVLLPLLKLRFALMSVPLLLLAWWRSGRSRRTTLWVGMALVVTIGGILLFNLIVFDKPFKDHTLAQLLDIQGRAPADYLRGVIGLFWDSAFGLLASNPMWLLLVPALALALWQRPPVLTHLLVCVVPYLAVVSPRREWYGAWAPPFRFGIVLLPILALVLVPLLRRRQQAGAKGLVTALGFMAMSLLLLWVVVPGWTFNLAVGTHHLLDHLAIRLSADVARFFPSLVRPRMASWLVPILVSSLAIALWWYPRRRPRTVGVWATAVMLLGLAVLPVAASQVPTGTVEFEDRQVVKSGGQLYPDPWVPYRPRFRGGWKLAAGQSVRSPIAGGGQQTSIEIDLKRLDRATDTGELVILAGSQRLGAVHLDADRAWQTVTLDGLEWPLGADLTVEISDRGSAGPEVEVILDRARFRWQ